MSAGREAKLAEQVRALVALLDRAAGSEPGQLKALMAEAERAAVRLRDTLIAWLRDSHDGSEGPRYRALLERTNVAISLIVGVANPITTIRWDYLSQARAVIGEMDKEIESRVA